MNGKLDYEAFLKLKFDKSCIDIDQDIITTIFESFLNNGTKSKKNIKYHPKKTVNIFKNPKIKLLKDKISNKINLILNKISENNIDNLIVEFIENIRIQSQDEYNEFLRVFYLKILSEINFSKIYLNFFNLITATFKIVYDYNNKYFYDLIQNKFTYDYYEVIDDNYIYLTEIDDDIKRLNNLTLIKELIKINYFNSTFVKYIEEKLLNQTKYLADIHHWFKNNELNPDIINKIKSLVNDSTHLRDKILLENLINGISQSESEGTKIVFKKQNIPPIRINEPQPISNSKNKISKTLVELENIIEEYLFLDNTESIEEYISCYCVDAINKNKLCEYIIEKYFKLSDDEFKKILDLFKILVKKKILYKSNLSRGLLNLYSNKVQYPESRVKLLLLFLKNIGITKGLEIIMQKHNIEISV